MERPNQNEYKPYYHRYIEQVPDGDIMKILKKQISELEKICKTVSTKKSLYRYAPEKWSIRELIGHIIDTERIMAYRALRFSRNDSNNLPGFDQDEYVKYAGHDKVRLNDLMKEFKSLRESNIMLFNSFTEEMQLRQGTANNNLVSVRALIYVIAGHFIHHLNVLKEKYLK